MLREIAQDCAQKMVARLFFWVARCNLARPLPVESSGCTHVCAREERGRVRQRVATQHHALMRQLWALDLCSVSSPSPWFLHITRCVFLHTARAKLMHQHDCLIQCAFQRLLPYKYGQCARDRLGDRLISPTMSSTAGSLPCDSKHVSNASCFITNGCALLVCCFPCCLLFSSST